LVSDKFFVQLPWDGKIPVSPLLYRWFCRVRFSGGLVDPYIFGIGATRLFASDWVKWWPLAAVVWGVSTFSDRSNKKR
jgi:hypothetical protein